MCSIYILPGPTWGDEPHPEIWDGLPGNKTTEALNDDVALSSLENEIQGHGAVLEIQLVVS